MLARVKFLSLMTPAQRLQATKLLFLMFVGMLLEMLGIGLIIPLIAVLGNEQLASHSEALTTVGKVFGIDSNSGRTILVMLGFAGAFFVKSLFATYLAYRRAQFAFRLQTDLSVRLYQYYLSQPYTFHLQKNSAQLVNTLSTEVAVCTAQVVQPFMQILTEGLVVVGLLALLMYFEPMGTVVVGLLLAGPSAVLHYLSRDRVSGWGRRRRYHEGMRTQHVQQGLGAIKAIKLTGREKEFVNQFSRHVELASYVGRRQTFLLQTSPVWLEFISVVGLSGLVIILVATGYRPAEILSTLGLFGAAAFRLMPSVNRILSSLQLLRFGLPTSESIADELNSEPPPETQSRNALQNSNWSRLNVESVSFTYPGEAEPSIKDVSLSVGRGDMIGFLGTSGSGKSTLVDLILGLLDPQLGRITLDDMDTRDCKRSWQSQIGYVPQTIYLTDETLRNNVALGVPESDIDVDAVNAAIHAAQLGPFVASLSEGLETRVGERGIRLSGGERQRLGIARALYHRPTTLILDEATSALDSATETELMKSIVSMRGERTILLVAHRLSTLANCDRVYQIEQGTISQYEHSKL